MSPAIFVYSNELDFLASAKEVMFSSLFVCVSVCLSVCLFVTNFVQKLPNGFA